MEKGVTSGKLLIRRSEQVCKGKEKHFQVGKEASGLISFYSQPRSLAQRNPLEQFSNITVHHTETSLGCRFQFSASGT